MSTYRPCVISRFRIVGTDYKKLVMPMARRKIANTLALAVLGLLQERPMHPYEMAATLRERHKDSSFKIN